jgi:crossover junction endodeoxyribonuclease RuvC
MLVIGFDPGSIRFGVGIVRAERGRVSFVHAETIRLAGEFPSRVRELWARLRDLIGRFPPQAAAMEEGFLGKNVRSMSLLAMVRGVALASLAEAEFDVALYAPREIKLAATGYGNATKEQVDKMVRLLLRLGNRTFGADESDALAVAMCHALRLPS